MQAWKNLILVVVVFLAGCGQGVIQQAPLPVIEPIDALPELALAQQESEIENLSLDGNIAINFAGMVNGYRTEFESGLSKWKPELYRVAEAYALSLATNSVCFQQVAQNSESAESTCGGLDQLKQLAEAQGYAFKNILGTSYVSIGQPFDFESATRAWSAVEPYKRVFANKQVKDIGAAVVRSGNAIIYVAVLANE